MSLGMPPFPRRASSQERGFTLVEMLVTLAIFGILLTLTAREVVTVGGQEVHSTDSVTALDEAEVLLQPITNAIRFTTMRPGPVPAPAIYLACPYELVFEASLGPGTSSAPSLLAAFLTLMPAQAPQPAGASTYEMYLDAIAEPAGGLGSLSCPSGPSTAPPGTVERSIMDVSGVLTQPGTPLFAYYAQGASQPITGTASGGGLAASQNASVESVQLSVTLRYGASTVTGAGGTATSLDLRVHLENEDFALEHQAQLGTNCYLQAIESSAPFAYWPMSEPSGPEIPDKSGSAAPDNATMVGTATPGIMPGPVPCDLQGSGTDFSNDAYATTASRVALPSQVSLEAWFETPSGGGLLAFGSSATGSSSQAGPSLWVGAGGHLHFGVISPGGVVVSVASSRTAGIVATGGWTYVVATVSGAGVSLYLDGALVASAPPTPVAASEGYWRLAELATTEFTGSLEPFDGALADVAVYPYALSSAEVASHYEAAGYVPGSPPPLNQDCLSAGMLAERPLAFWRLDDPAGSSSASDLSGNGYTGKLVGGVTSGTPANPYMPACDPMTTVDSFDGSSGEITTPVGTPEVPLFEAGQAGLTVEAWFDLSSVPSDDPRVVADAETNATQSGLGANEGFELVIDGETGNGGRDLVANGYVDMGNGSTQAAAPWVKVIQPGTWHLYTATYDGSSVRAYLDGELVGRASLAGPIAAAPWPVTIGADPAAGTNGGDFFGGEIADVAIYRYALSASQVLEQYEAGTGGGA